MEKLRFALGQTASQCSILLYSGGRVIDRTKMDQLPLRRNDNGEIQLEGIGAINLQIIYDSVLGSGGQAVVFKGRIYRKIDSQLVMQVGGIRFGVVYFIQVAFSLNDGTSYS